MSSFWDKVQWVTETRALLAASIFSFGVGCGVVVCVISEKYKNKNKKFHVSSSDEPKILMQEQLSRNTLFYGQEAQRKVEDAYVVVVGVGGVGSHAANILARSGVKQLKLIDFDQVTLSSLNRHALALRSDVGKSKVEVCVCRLLLIASICISTYTGPTHSRIQSNV
eukprot:m.164228 g.164228  ORF g.164228 m.164228 type:complete len:167 (-) comp15231_c0_seq12:1080-1580(-)